MTSSLSEEPFYLLISKPKLAKDAKHIWRGKIRLLPYQLEPLSSCPENNEHIFNDLLYLPGSIYNRRLPAGE